jgi:hypothetical protein
VKKMRPADVFHAEAQIGEPPGDFIEHKNARVLERRSMHAAVEGDEEAKLFGGGVRLHGGGAEDRELLRVGMHLESPATQIERLLHLIGDVIPAHIDRAKRKEPILAPDFAGEPFVGGNAILIAGVWEGGEADTLLDLARIHEAEQSIDGAIGIHRCGEDVRVIGGDSGHVSNLGSSLCCDTFEQFLADHAMR